MTGRIYDPYIRLLLWEGVRSWWRAALPAWLSCGASRAEAAYTIGSHTEQLAFASSDTPAESRSISEVVCPFVWASETHKTTCALGFPANYDDELADSMLDLSQEDDVEIEGRLLEVGGNSPFYRKIRGASIACSDCSLSARTLMTDIGLYTDTKAVERLLVQGGLRLAATLNTVLGPAAERAGFRHATTEADAAWTRDGAYFGWLKEAE